MKLTEFFRLDNAEKSTNQPPLKLATVFSGIGAVEFAFKRMGLEHEIVLACDNDKFVKESYFANYKILEDNWYSDIESVNNANFMCEGRIDLLVGGSPCQSFSSVGDGDGFSDPRGTLVFEFFKLIKKIKPRIFIFENVRALRTKEYDWEIFSKELNKTGYFWKEKVLNSKDFGIPQNRERLFVVGFMDKKHWESFGFPKKRNLQVTQHNLLLDSAFINDQFNGHPTIDISNLMNFESTFIIKREFINNTVDEKYFLSEKVTKYVLSSGTKNFHSKPKLDLDVARPLLATMHKMHRAGVDNYFQEKYNGRIRKLAPRECLRLMGFDDRFKQVVSDTRMYMQAGNSIVVDVLIAIIGELMNILYEV